MWGSLSLSLPLPLPLSTHKTTLIHAHTLNCFSTCRDGPDNIHMCVSALVHLHQTYWLIIVSHGQAPYHHC